MQRTKRVKIKDTQFKHRVGHCSCSVLTGLIDHESGGIGKKFSQRFEMIVRQLGFEHGVVHEFHPAITGSLINFERHVPHAQPRMATLLDIMLRPAEPVDQKIRQSLTGTLKIIRGIHRPKNVIGRNLGVKAFNEAGETVGAEDVVDGRHEGRHGSMVGSSLKPSVRLANTPKGMVEL